MWSKRGGLIWRIDLGGEFVIIQTPMNSRNMEENEPLLPVRDPYKSISGDGSSKTSKDVVIPLALELASLCKTS